VFFIGIAGIVLMNLMTAVVLQQTIEKAEADAEAVAQKRRKQRLKIITQLYEIFMDLDEDRSGTLTREEFNRIVGDRRLVEVMGMLEIDLDELSEIFDILEDRSGTLKTGA